MFERAKTISVEKEIAYIRKIQEEAVINGYIKRDYEKYLDMIKSDAYKRFIENRNIGDVIDGKFVHGHFRDLNKSASNFLYMMQKKGILKKIATKEYLIVKKFTRL